MPDYWLDADALIEPHKRGYAFDLQPAFWTLIDQKMNEGVIGMPRKVYTEIVEDFTLPDGSKDALGQWLADRETLVHAAPDPSIQAFYGKLADHVRYSYTTKELNKFLKGADGWLIAHAHVLGGTVVTFEARKPNEAKIPNICDHFKVPCIDTWTMLRAFGVRFGLASP